MRGSAALLVKELSS